MVLVLYSCYPVFHDSCIPITSCLSLYRPTTNLLSYRLQPSYYNTNSQYNNTASSYPLVSCLPVSLIRSLSCTTYNASSLLHYRTTAHNRQTTSNIHTSHFPFYQPYVSPSCTCIPLTSTSPVLQHSSKTNQLQQQATNYFPLHCIPMSQLVS